MDGVTADMLKVEDAETPLLLTEIFRNILENEAARDAWQTGLIVKLPKKGDLSNCNN